MDEPDVKKLSHWCCKSAAVGFERGLYRRQELKLDEDSSKTILRNVRNKRAAITKELADELGSLCALKELSIGPEKTDTHLLHFASFQSLTALSVIDPSHLICDMEEENTFLESTYKKLDNKVKLNKMFDQLGKSRKSLQIFSMSECDGLYFTGDWVITMKNAFPNLTALILEGCDLNNVQFIQLATHYPELRYLSLIRTKITSVMFIERMKNLRELRLCGVQFGDREDLEELFQLQHLTDLDISASEDNESRTAFHFINCNKVLPNLQFLDCSFNKLTLQNAQQIVRTHPKLEVLGVLGVGISRSYIDSADEVLQVLNEADLRSHCRAIQQYTKKSWYDLLLYVIESMKRLGCINASRQPPTEIENATNLLISTLQTIHSGPAKRVLWCFLEIEKILQYCDLTPVQKNNLIEAVVKYIRGYTAYDENDDYTRDIYEKFWIILSKCIREATVVNKRLVHAVCIEQYNVVGNIVWYIGYFSGILEEICINDKNYKCEKMFHRQDLLDKSIELITRDSLLEISQVAFKQLFTIILRFYQLGGLYGSENHEFKLVNLLFVNSHLWCYPDESVEIKIRQGLKYFVIQQNSERRKTCFEKTNFETLMKPLIQNVAPTIEADLRLEALVLFFTLMNPTGEQKAKIAGWCDVARGFLARNTWTPGTEVFDIIMMILDDQEASELYGWANAMLEEMLAFDLTNRCHLILFRTYFS